jgi:hypothetical protein
LIIAINFKKEPENLNSTILKSIALKWLVFN